MRKNALPPRKPWNKLGRFLGSLGPGLITGAADNDPSGISTYSIVGAAFGYLPLWTALFSFPLMYAVQLMCANLGKVTAGGLATAVRKRFPPLVLWSACAMLITANIFNIGADLIGMAVATEMLTGIRPAYLTVLYTLFILGFLFFSKYKLIYNVLKWLCFVLFSYVLSAFLAHPDWSKAIVMTLVPRVEWSAQFLSAIVALLGTTISPYLFFWQASQEVEVDRSNGKDKGLQGKHTSNLQMKKTRNDVFTGMSFSNLTMFFIILTTAATLNVHGQTRISTFKEAAEALRPLAGDGAYLLFTLGIVGTGLLTIPVLAGSGAYAVAEAKRWRGSLEDTPRTAPKFYGVVAVSMLLGLALDALGVNAVKMLYYSAILNGLLAPPLIVLIVLLTGNPKVMGRHVASPMLRLGGWTSAVVMAAAGAGLLLTL